MDLFLVRVSLLGPCVFVEIYRIPFSWKFQDMSPLSSPIVHLFNPPKEPTYIDMGRSMGLDFRKGVLSRKVETGGKVVV